MLMIRRSGTPPMMLTTDLALKMDPIYAPIRSFHENRTSSPTHSPRRGTSCCTATLGPVSRYLGPWVPEPQLWRGSVPEVDHDLIGDEDIAALKGKILASGPSLSRLVSTAWASAVSFRGKDKRGGANRARLRLAPQKGLGGQRPGELAKVLQPLEQISRTSTSRSPAEKKVSLADLIVLGGCAAVEQAAKNAGHDIAVPFVPGRLDASQGTDRRGSRSPRSNRPPTGSATTSEPGRGCRRRPCCWTGRTC